MKLPATSERRACCAARRRTIFALLLLKGIQTVKRLRTHHLFQASRGSPSSLRIASTQSVAVAAPFLDVRSPLHRFLRS